MASTSHLDEHLQALWLIVQSQPVAALIAVCLVATTLTVLRQLTTLRPSEPGPTFLLPFIGDTLAILKDPSAYFLKGYLIYGGVFKTHMFGMRFYCVCDPATIRDIMKGDSSEDVTFSVPFTTFNKLVTDWDHQVDGPVHDQYRKVMSLALSPSSIERYLPALEKTIRQGLKSWADKGTVPLLEASGDMALDFAIDTLIGVELKHTDRSWFKQQLLQMMEGLYSVYLPLPGTTFTNSQTAKANVIAALSKELQSLVHEALKLDPAAGAAADAAVQLRRVDAAGKVALQKNRPEFQLDPAVISDVMSHLRGIDSISSVSGAPGVTLADASIGFLRAQRRLALETTAAQIMGMFIAAADTTRLTIFTTLTMLAQLPEEVDKLREEQQQMIARHGSELNPAVLSEMVYLDAAIKESSRILPASKGVMRQALRPLNLNGVHIPAGAHVFISTDCLHCLEPTLWQGPGCIPPGRDVPPYMDWRHNLKEAFQPARWLPSNPNKPKHFQTFGGGSHLCLGMNLVYAETKLLLSVMLRGYNWTFEQPRVLENMRSVFPKITPAPGADVVHIARRNLPSRAP